MKKLIAMTLTIALLLSIMTIPAAAITPGSWDIPGGVYEEVMKKVTAEERAKQEAREAEAKSDTMDEPEPEYRPAVRYEAWNWDKLRNR